MNLNKVILAGRVTKDIEVRQTPTGTSVATFGLATNHVYYDKNKQKVENVQFTNVVFWGKQAETIGQYVIKGQVLLVVGRLQTRKWTDKSNSVRYSTEVIGEEFQFGAKPQGAADNAAPSEPELGDGDIDPSDIPF